MKIKFKINFSIMWEGRGRHIKNKFKRDEADVRHLLRCLTSIHLGTKVY